MASYSVACSLDGFIAGPNGELDWLQFTPDAQEIMKASWAAVDTILMGRKTYDANAAKSSGGGSMPGISCYIASTTLGKLEGAGAEIANDAVALVRKLKGESGKTISIMGGGELAGSLLAAGLLDEVSLNIHPIVLGRGVPLFGDPNKRVTLELVSSRAIAGGCVFTSYRAAR
jgi:dihydrofolate reductase